MRSWIVSCIAALALAGASSVLDRGTVVEASPWTDPPARDEQSAAPATCCFTNPQYAGVCAVTPADEETCASILAYLNNPQSQGKSYCASTAIRGGWKQSKCDPP